MVGAALRPGLAGVKPRIQTGRGISGALRYVKGQGRDPKTGRFKTLEPGEESRAELLGGTGFGFAIDNEADAELARKMMEYAALNQGSKTRKCEQDCLHLTLSWERGEKPTNDEKMAAARSALAAQGMGNAMALVYSHNDEDYEHVHIVASKINPETRRAYDLAGSWRKASIWAEQYELDHGGVINTNRQSANELRKAIADRDVDGVLEAMTKRNATFTARQLERALQKEIHPKIGAAAGQKAQRRTGAGAVRQRGSGACQCRAARRPVRRSDDAVHDARRARSRIACAAGGGRPQGGTATATRSTSCCASMLIPEQIPHASPPSRSGRSCMRPAPKAWR